MVTIKERFEDKIFYSPDGCWYWIASTCRGYGKFFIKKEKGKPIFNRANRFSYELYKGPIPDKMHVCHCCDNPYCVNPDHLFIGTHQQNMQDALKKGRLFIPTYVSNGKPYGPQKDLTGMKFNMLLVLSYAERIGRLHHWLCLCDCGKKKIVAGTLMINNYAFSCGCLRNRKKYLQNKINDK